MNAMLNNYWTTITGIAVGIGQYLATAGAKMPMTGQEWSSFILGLGLAVLGIVSKDATTGSTPK